MYLAPKAFQNADLGSAIGKPGYVRGSITVQTTMSTTGVRI
jgi:hypothetical protein